MAWGTWGTGSVAPVTSVMIRINLWSYGRAVLVRRFVAPGRDVQGD